MSTGSLTRGIFTSRLYPLALQAITAAVFLLIVLYAFLGPPLGEDNFAVVVTWRLWWLLLPLSFLLFGRLWCGICPVGAASDLAQKAPFARRRAPGPLLRKSGVWVMAALFLLLFWVGMVRHICCWPQETAVMLLLFVGGALLTGLLYRGRVWCRYLCPLGIFSGTFSMLGLIGLRSRRAACRAGCKGNKQQVLQRERQGCPLFELPVAVDSNRYCTLCGNCLKFCQHHALEVATLSPGRELWRVRRPLAGEAIFALILVAIALAEAIQTTRLFPISMRWAMELNVLSSYDAMYTLMLLAMVALIVGSYILASLLSTRLGGKSRPAGLASFGYGFVPLALAGYLGVGALRLANHGVRAVQVAVNQLSFSLAPFDLPPPVRGSFYEVDLPLKVAQLAILALGTLATLYALQRIGRRGGPAGAMARALPHMVLALLLAASLLTVYLLPAGVILH